MQNTQTSSIPLATRKLAAISYVPLLGIVVLLRRDRDPFLRFHAWQGCILSAYLVLAYLTPNIGPYLAIAFFAVSCTGFLHAIHGREYRVPLLGDAVAWCTKQR